VTVLLKGKLANKVRLQRPNVVRGQGDRQLRLAVADVADGVALWRLWGRLGWNDILQRYRRSLLGPLWLTASMGIMVLALGVVYARILKMALDDFMPFLCVGLLIWSIISSVLTEAGTLFTGAESYIKQIRLPYSVYVCRFMWSKTVIFAHNFVIYIGIVIYFKLQPGGAVLWAMPGFVLILLNGALASLYVGMVSARFRDVPQLIASIVQIIFFMTPIMWKPELLGSKSVLMTFNPFYHLVEIVRAPLLGQVPSAENYIALGLISMANFLLAAVLFVRFRARISYWV
jgi:ABC-type polysaccharide/polyol phosphate export permease